MPARNRAKILDKKADYDLALKNNQGSLREDVEILVAEQKAKRLADTKICQDTTTDGDDRVETRTCPSLTRPKQRNILELFGIERCEVVANPVVRGVPSLNGRERRTRASFFWPQLGDVGEGFHACERVASNASISTSSSR